jgi:hypothetical protein
MPATIPESGRLFGCADDIGEEYSREYPVGDCHIATGASAKRRRLRDCQAAATAVRPVSIATARSARCVRAEVR